MTTIDEIVETQLLWLRGTNIFSKWIAWGVFLWVLIVFLITYFGDGPVVNKIFVGILLGGFIGGNVIFNYKSIIRKRIKRVLIKKLGFDEPFPATVIMENDKIEYSSNCSTTSFRLSDLECFEELSDGLALNFKKGGLLYISNAAFCSESEQSEWKDMLHTKLTNIT